MNTVKNSLKIWFFALMILLTNNGCFFDLMKQENKAFLLESQKQWYVYKILTKDGLEITPPEENTKSTMSFDIDENRIFGIASCNNYFATFALDNRTLTISQKGASRRICFPNESLEYEYIFLQELEGIFKIKKSGKKMQLIGENATYYLQQLSESPSSSTTMPSSQ